MCFLGPKMEVPGEQPERPAQSKTHLRFVLSMFYLCSPQQPIVARKLVQHQLESSRRFYVGLCFGCPSDRTLLGLG